MVPYRADNRHTYELTDEDLLLITSMLAKTAEIFGHRGTYKAARAAVAATSLLDKLDIQFAQNHEGMDLRMVQREAQTKIRRFFADGGEWNNSLTSV